MGDGRVRHRERDRRRGRRFAAAAVALALAVVAMAAAAAAQTEDRLVIRDVDLDGYPLVVLDAQYAGPRLDSTSFVLREDGRVVRPLRVVWRETTDRPVSVVIALDRSGSMGESGAIEQAKLAAASFVEGARPGDRIGLVAFDTLPERILDPGASTDELLEAIAAVEAKETTALWDAIALSAQMLADEPNADRYILVVSDVDAASYDNASLGTSADAIAAALGADASVLVVGLPLGPVDDRELREVTDATGGLLLYETDPTRLTGIFGEIQSSLATSYEVSYTSTAEGPIVDLLLTAQTNQATVSFEVPEVTEEPVVEEPSDDGGLPVLAILAVAVLVIGGAGVVVARRR